MLFSSILLLTSCDQETGSLEYAYSQAGENSSELRKVISYFSVDRISPLKLEGAKYIIENMPKHQSMNDTAYASYSKRLRTVAVPVGTNLLNSLWTPKNVLYSPDLAVVNSGFLIDDIENAFQTRDSVPWGSSIPFDIFKDYVLPYKVHSEAITPNWRVVLYNNYKHLIEGITDPKEAFAKVYNHLKRVTRESNSNFRENMDPLSMDYLKRGSCSQLCVYYVAVLRSLGLPASYEYIESWGNYSQLGHSWVAYIDSLEIPYTIASNDSVLKTMNPIDASTFKEHYNPGNKNFSINRRKTTYKIYRHCYRIVSNREQEVNDGRKHLVHQKDVSRGYGLTRSIVLHAKDHKYVSLSVFSTGKDWREFTLSKVRSGRASFDDLGDSVIYLPTFYENKRTKETGIPFFINSRNEPIWIEPQEHNYRNVLLRRKYPLFGNWTAQWHKMEGAKVQVADTKDFKSAKDIYTVKETPIGRLSFEVPPSTSAKYIRYVCPPASRTPIAEFRFFDEQENRIPISETIACRIDSTELNLAFDDNELTSASTKKEEFWVGAKLDELSYKRLHRIEIVPKNDGNFINPGELYHLYYFDKKWISVGEQKANSNVLSYNRIPNGALLLLKNLSKGDEERIFTFNGLRQIWW